MNLLSFLKQKPLSIPVNSLGIINFVNEIDTCGLKNVRVDFVYNERHIKDLVYKISLLRGVSFIICLPIDRHDICFESFKNLTRPFFNLENVIGFELQTTSIAIFKKYSLYLTNITNKRIIAYIALNNGGDVSFLKDLLNNEDFADMVSLKLVNKPTKEFIKEIQKFKLPKIIADAFVEADIRTVMKHIDIEKVFVDIDTFNRIKDKVNIC